MAQNQAYLGPGYDDEKNFGGHIEEKESGSYQYGAEDVGAPVVEEETHRSLKPRQISMIAIGGAIGEYQARCRCPPASWQLAAGQLHWAYRMVARLHRRNVAWPHVPLSS